MTPTTAELLTALHSSHDRLVATVTPLSGELTAGSYCSDWTIAQVASHLGSGAEIFRLFVEAGLQQSAQPSIEQFRAIWARWDAKTPQEQAADALVAGAAFLDWLASLTADERERWRMHMFDAERNLADVLRMRLGELAVHTWDMAVIEDPQATVAQGAVELLVDTLGALAERAGKPTAPPLRVHVTTTDPDRELILDLGDGGVRLEPAGAGAAEATASLRLPAEALLRLVYGRLDPGHTPESVRAEGVELGTLRSAFPGV